MCRRQVHAEPSVSMGFDEHARPWKGSRVLSYRATLTLPRTISRTILRWLSAHRRAHDTRPWHRAVSPWVQTVMLLRRLIEATDIASLARDARVSPATAYRYLDVVASKASDLPEILERLRNQDESLRVRGRRSHPHRPCHRPYAAGKPLMVVR